MFPISQLHVQEKRTSRYNFFTGEIFMSSAPNADQNVAPNTELEKRRKQLRFRSWHRGTQEADLIIGSFADQHIDEMGVEELNLFERVLEIPDPVLYDWIIGNSEPTEDMHNKVLDALLSFKYTPKPR